MENRDEREQREYFSTPHEKRNTQLLAGIFRGGKPLTGIDKPIHQLTRRQRAAIIEASLRARRVWKPTGMETIVSTAADHDHLAARGEVALARKKKRQSISDAIKGEHFALALEIIGDGTREHVKAYKTAKLALEQLHGLHEIQEEMREAIKQIDGRSERLAMLLVAPPMVARPLSRRAEILQASLFLRIHASLGQDRLALPYAEQLRRLGTAAATRETLAAHFQGALISARLGDFETTKSDLVRLMAMEIHGPELIAYRTSEHAILAFSIAIVTKDIAMGNQAIGLLQNVWRPAQASLIETKRHAQMLRLALEFTLLARMPATTEEIIQRHQLSRQMAPEYRWCHLAIAAHWFVWQDWDAADNARKSIKRFPASASSRLLADLLGQYLREPSSAKRQRLLEKYAAKATELPAQERGSFDLPMALQLKLGVDWRETDGGNLAAASS